MHLRAPGLLHCGWWARTQAEQSAGGQQGGTEQCSRVSKNPALPGDPSLHCIHLTLTPPGQSVWAWPVSRSC